MSDLNNFNLDNSKYVAFLYQKYLIYIQAIKKIPVYKLKVFKGVARLQSLVRYTDVHMPKTY